MIEIDGAQGEGGGQVLRTALSLSLYLGKPFHIFNIRKTRARPGLQPQHLMAVKAAAAIGKAETEGAEPDSSELIFRPRGIQAGFHEFDIGTAGSTTLVLQTLFLPLLLADRPSEILIHGGTHNPLAPPYEFLASSFLPLLRRMGADIDLQLERHGFYPRGGGRMRARIQPAHRLRPLEILERGEPLGRRATSLLCGLPQHIAERELSVLRESLGLTQNELTTEMVEAYSPANVLFLALKYENLSEVFTALGIRGVPAEQVAQGLVDEIQRYLRTSAPVGIHLADQLLLPLALAGGGRYRTLSPSRHTLTNIDIIHHFLDLPIDTRELAQDDWMVTIG